MKRAAAYHVVERRDAGERLAAERVGGELAEGRRHGHGGRWWARPSPVPRLWSASTRDFGSSGILVFSGVFLAGYPVLVGVVGWPGQ